MRQLIKEYFSFTKKERVAVIALLAVILAAYCAPYFIRTEHKTPSVKELAELKKLEEGLDKVGKERDDGKMKEHPPPNDFAGNENNLPGKDNDLYADQDNRHIDHSASASLFYFDPNNISEDGWKKLGLRAKTIGTILKYLSKGGRFYEPPDLKKIYGLHADEYERLEPYIQIKTQAQRSSQAWSNSQARESYDGAGNKQVYADAASHQPAGHQPARHQPIYKPKAPIDINDADSTALISLPGIGSKLAARIVSFREKLGGFHSIEQIAETYGLADSTFQKIRTLLTVLNTQPRKININTATLETLKQHPYIRWSIASAIIRYREQHGPFASLAGLQQIAAITPDVYNKLLPYVSLSD
jgi:competence ComEA-like helix-hairpin-helix protein